MRNPEVVELGWLPCPYDGDGGAAFGFGFWCCFALWHFGCSKQKAGKRMQYPEFRDLANYPTI